MVGRGVHIAGRARQAGRGDVELVDPVADAPLGEPAGRGLEGARLDDIAADREKRLMDAADDIGPRQHQMVVTALERLAAEIGCREVVALDVGPHGAVVDEDAIGEGLEIGGRHVGCNAGSGEADHARTGFGTQTCHNECHSRQRLKTKTPGRVIAAGLWRFSGMFYVAASCRKSPRVRLYDTI